VLEFTVIIISILAIFLAVAWYAYRSSKQRSQLLKDIDNIEPKLGESEQFGAVFQQELQQQTIDSERFDIDSEPTISLSDGAQSHIDEQQIEINRQTSKEKNESITSDRIEEDLKIQSIDEPIKKQGIASDNINDWEMVVAFTIMARDGTTFSGRAIKTTLESLDLHFGDLQIYHRQVPGLRTQALFSVANILDPGTLNPDSFATMQTPGLLIFSRLPGPVNGLTLFDDLLDTAQKMADKLNGVLSDESRQAVSQATIEAMRSRILTMNLQLQAEQNHYNNDYSN